METEFTVMKNHLPLLFLMMILLVHFCDSCYIKEKKKVVFILYVKLTCDLVKTSFAPQSGEFLSHMSRSGNDKEREEGKKEKRRESEMCVNKESLPLFYLCCENTIINAGFPPSSSLDFILTAAFFLFDCNTSAGWASLSFMGIQEQQ